MGGTSSKTTAEVLTDISINASMNSLLNCVSSAAQSQTIDTQQTTGNVTIQDINLKQGATIDSSCVMKSEKRMEISNAVAAALAQYAESKGQAVLSALGSTKAEAVSKISNNIQSKLSQDTEQTFKTIVEQNQGITTGITGGNVVIKNITMDQGAKVSATALMQTSAFSSSINDVANKIDQTSKTEEKTIFGDIADAIKNFFLSVVGLITAAAVFLVVILMVIF